MLSRSCLSVRGHGRNLLEEGESHGGMFYIRLEDLIDFHFPGGGSGGFVGFWSGDGWLVWFGGRRLGGC